MCFVHRIGLPVALWFLALSRKYLPNNGILQRASLDRVDRHGAGEGTGRIVEDGEFGFSRRGPRMAPWRGMNCVTQMSIAGVDDSPHEDRGEVLLTRQQLAQRLQTSLRTIDYWREHEGLPFLKIGHTVLFRWSDVLRHLEKTTGKASGRKPLNGAGAKAPDADARLNSPPLEKAFSE